MSCTLHVLIRSTLDLTKFHCRIVRASNKAKMTSAPSSECLSDVLGLNVVTQWLDAVYHMFCHEKDHFNLFVLGDSKSALQGL